MSLPATSESNAASNPSIPTLGPGLTSLQLVAGASTGSAAVDRATPMPALSDLADSMRLDRATFGIETVLGSAAVIRGDLNPGAGLEFCGKIRGDLTAAEHAMIIREGAFVHGNVTAAIVVVLGNVLGNIRATNLVILGKGCNVQGQVEANRVNRRDGAVHIGSSKMLDDVAVLQSPFDE